MLKRKNPAGNYMFKVNNINTRTRCELCSKLTLKTVIVNFEHFSHLALVFLFFNFKQVNAGLEILNTMSNFHEMIKHVLKAK